MDRAALLEETIRSVRAQTHRPIEHIVVDGGSTDGTVDLLRSLREAPTTNGYELRWVSGADRGMYDAINKGLEMARGQVVAYLNSDDRYFPWSAECAVEALTRHPEVALIYGDVIRVDDLRGVLVPVFQPPFHPSRMAAFGTLFQPTVFMRRAVVEQLGGFDADLRYVADLDFWLRAAQTFQFRQLREFLALERRHSGMLSETAARPMMLEDRRVRSAYRHGFWASRPGPMTGRTEWHLWSGIRWLAFVRAAWGGGLGWKRTIQACGPRVDFALAIAGTLPSGGSRYRAGLRWKADPRTVASGS
jgi:glycosyltransferase involved in cell wall biosynthesis